MTARPPPCATMRRSSRSWWGWRRRAERRLTDRSVSRLRHDPGVSPGCPQASGRLREWWRPIGATARREENEQITSVTFSGFLKMQRTSISLADFREITGTTISERVAGYYGWQSTRRNDGTWAYDKTLQSAPLPVSKVVDGCGRRFEGPNYCSQDYLSLASHEAIKEAA